MSWWKRTLGISSTKRAFARATGIPTTRSGRAKKWKRLFGGGDASPLFGLTFVFGRKQEPSLLLPTLGCLGCVGVPVGMLLMCGIIGTVGNP